MGVRAKYKPFREGYIEYVPLPRPLTDQTLENLRNGKREMPTFYRTVNRWIDRLLEERKRYKRIIRRLAQ